MSVCKKNNDIIDKNNWLDKYAPFFCENNRIIISKEGKNKASKELKGEYLSSIKTKDTIIVIDDDNEMLKYLKSKLPEYLYFQDSSIID